MGLGTIGLGLLQDLGVMYWVVGQVVGSVGVVICHGIFGKNDCLLKHSGLQEHSNLAKHLVPIKRDDE